MAGEWRERALGEVIELKRGYDLPQQDRRPGHVPIVSSSGVTDYHAEAMAKGPGVVTGRYGTLGEVFYIEQDFWPLNTTLYVRDFKGNDPRFISYFLRGLDFLAYSDKAAVPGINRNHLHQARVIVPTDVGEQRAIAHILGTLDDKIELNRRMSETLEAMARALFKSWFVDFDPVRAKMEGRWQRGRADGHPPLQPALPAHLYDLFPDRLVKSELGEIPEGWEVGTLGDLTNVVSGKRPPVVFEEPLANAHIPLWGGNGPMGYVSEPLFSEPILLTGRVGTLGSVFRIVGPCWPSDNTLVVCPCAIDVIEYVFFSMKNIDFDALNRGSTQPLLTQTDLKNQPILVPPAEILRAFHGHASIWFYRIDRANDQSRTLAALRDALLPKLIRGEIRVKDAERFLKDRGL
jgi:type I restriction enzyme S subunit